jgi:hypothetical protein
MNQAEFITAIEIFGRQQTNEAARLRLAANQVRTDAETYAQQHVGAAMQSTRERIIADAEATAQDCLAEAEQCERRAEVAGRGYMPVDDADTRNPAYSMGHQKLITAAGKLGLLWPPVHSSQPMMAGNRGVTIPGAPVPRY